MTTVDIIIVNWNTGVHLRQCLASIDATQKAGFEISRIVVVDNASSDNSLSRTNEFTLPITLVQNDQNLGFAAACNQGAKGSQSDYLLFLNPDVRLFENSLTLPLEFMQNPQNQNVGICGIKLVDENKQMTLSASRFPAPKVIVGTTTGLAKIFPKTFPAHMMSPNELSNSQIVDQIIGAFFLVRKSVYDACAGFDERFFVYFEEVDFSLRAKMKGFDSYYLAEAEAFHEGHGSSDNVKAKRLFYSLRSRTFYGLKHFSGINNVVLITLMFTVELAARLLLSLKRRSFSSFVETLSGYGMLVRYFCLGR